MSARCTTELVAQGWDSPIDGFSVESDDVPQYSELGYAQPRQPIGQGWGTFGQVALAYSPDSRDAAFAGASFVAMANAMYPVQATAPAQRGRIGYPSDIPPDACPSCTPFEDGCLEGTEVSPTTPQITTIYYNSAQTASAPCPDGLEGPSVSYTVPAGAYSSTVSQADADSKAYDDALAHAQSSADLKCCASPTEIEDLSWQQESGTTPTASWSFTDGGNGSFSAPIVISGPQPEVFLRADLCNPWGTYDVTISIAITLGVHVDPYYVCVGIAMDGSASTFDDCSCGLHGSCTKTVSMTPGNHYFEIHIKSSNIQVGATITLTPVHHP